MERWKDGKMERRKEGKTGGRSEGTVGGSLSARVVFVFTCQSIPSFYIYPPFQSPEHSKNILIPERLLFEHFRHEVCRHFF
jgi:hypothetical protein